MEIETITKLLDAGYTKTEIDALSANAGTSESAESGAPNESATEVQSEANPQNASEVAPEIKALTETVNALTATVKAMQESNVKGAATESPKTSDKIKAAMDSFIESL